MIQMIKYQIEWKMINSLSAGADSVSAAPPTIHTFEQQWFKMRFNTDEILGNEPTAHLQSLSIGSLTVAMTKPMNKTGFL